MNNIEFKPRFDWNGFDWNAGFQPAGGQDVRAPGIHSWTRPKENRIDSDKVKHHAGFN